MLESSYGGYGAKFRGLNVVEHGGHQSLLIKLGLVYNSMVATLGFKSCECSVAFPSGALGWSAVSDCGIS